MRQTLIAFWLGLMCWAGSAVAGDSIAPRQLAARIGGTDAPLVLDVRTPEEFAQGHVPGAVLIPHDQLAQRLDEIPADRELVLYCHSGRRSTLAERVLAEHGRPASQLEGSWIGWQAAGLPRESAGQGE